jgi:hypothetical protein
MSILLVVVVGLAHPVAECVRAVQNNAADSLEGHDPSVAPRAERSLADPEGLGGFVLRPGESVGDRPATDVTDDRREKSSALPVLLKDRLRERGHQRRRAGRPLPRLGRRVVHVTTTRPRDAASARSWPHARLGHVPPL